MSNAILVMVALAAAAPVSAQQSIPAPSTSARFGALRPQSDPYKTLFVPQTWNQPAIKSPAATPKVVCGMTIIPADPKIDPKMLRAPKHDGIDYKMRAIDPPICNPSR